jgi:lysophospholipid acyltransferase (LPLAT)-like uncharacterized protein
VPKAGNYNTAVTPQSAATRPQANSAAQYTLRQRLLLSTISTVGHLGIAAIGATLRLSIHIEDGGPADFYTRPVILCFWHEAIFPSTYAFRNQQISVLTSQSFDGEYIGRIISKFGYMPVRGSSSRGGARALLQSRRVLEKGLSVAFTTDGPRGPALVAKPGPITLARSSGVPIVPFHVAIESSWRLRSWDRSVIPKPFSRALLWIGGQILVPRNASEAEMDTYHRELQSELERVRELAERDVKRVGTPEFPTLR